MCSDLIVDTVSGTTHMKMKFSFSPGVVKHFSGNAHWSSDNCHVSHSHFALFHNKSLLQTPRGVKPGEQGDQEVGAPLPTQ